MKRFHYSEFASYGYEETPTLALLELEAAVPTVPVCVDLLSEWPREGTEGLVSKVALTPHLLLRYTRRMEYLLPYLLTKEFGSLFIYYKEIQAVKRY